MRKFTSYSKYEGTFFFNWLIKLVLQVSNHKISFNLLFCCNIARSRL